MRVTVRVADDAQGAIDGWLVSTAGRRAVLVEGAFVPLAVPVDVALARLPAGCPCCAGLVPLKVGITRAVRAVRPDALLLVMAGSEHVERVRALFADGSLGARFEVE